MHNVFLTISLENIFITHLISSSMIQILLNLSYVELTIKVVDRAIKSKKIKSLFIFEVQYTNKSKREPTSRKRRE